jgi:hypothetical protein
MTWNYSFFCAFAKLWKATISLVMSACLSALMEQLGSDWTDSQENWYSSFFLKLVDYVQVLLKSERNNDYFTCLCFYLVIIYRWILLRMRNVSDKSCGENQTYVLCSVIFFLENVGGLRDNVEKYCTAGQITGDSVIRRMRVVCWITKAVNTHSESEILPAFPLQLVARTCLDVALCVYCLCCWSNFWILV